MGASHVVGAAGAISVAPVAGGGPVAVVSAGPPGADGVATSFTHSQVSPSADWVVNHNLGVRPLVTVLSVGGVEIEANVVHVNANQLRVYFASPQTGSVRCI